ncbi:hypothetical protein AB0N87_35315 [Streptomyces sp. NPDC093228]|uniref:hypothetical protein n=1 Tax=Streptomyces sp. NPDC093228 TaxID=3155070 RepID=UPI00341C2218
MQVLFDDGHGATQIQVTLNNQTPVPLCPDSAYHPYSECTHTVQSGGAQLSIDISPVTDTTPSAIKRWTALYTAPDGRQVFVSEINARTDKDTAPTRSVPPLSTKRLAAIAASGTWNRYLSALPVPSAPPSIGPKISAKQITDTLTRLLPTEMSVSDPQGSDGFGHVVLNDGHGPSLVAMNVQLWKPDDPRIHQVFDGARTLSDGTRITTSEKPPALGGEGAIEWTVDTLREDGLRVVVSSNNARAYGVPSTRKDPALSIPQLQEIALDPSWQQLLPQ